MQRTTKQRSAVLADLKNRCDHPTADMVYISVRQQIPNISKGTVYRNLKELTEAEEIISFTEQGIERFDGNASPHIHFCCRRCGRIDDLMLPDVSSLGMLLDDGFLVQNMIIEGICGECRESDV